MPADPTCWIGGECKGNKIHIAPSPQSKEECLEECKITFGCKWFTFHQYKSPQPACLLFSDCSSIDETCETCISGERRCQSGVLSTTITATTTTAAATTTTTTTTGTPVKYLIAPKISLKKKTLG